MNGIKSLADELRESIKKDVESATTAKVSEKKRVKKNNRSNHPTQELLAAIQAFELTGREKLLIRLDERTVFLMKQLKIAGGIDMNRLIAYSLNGFLQQHPELIQYIKENIKTIEL